MSVSESLSSEPLEITATQPQIIPPVAYHAIQNALAKCYPQTLTLVELAKSTGKKQIDVLLSINHGLEIGALVRDATYYPARYQVNPAKVNVFDAPDIGTDLERPSGRVNQKNRQSGVFKEIVAYLIKSGEHLSVDELIFKAGIKSSRQTLSTTLSAKYAQKAISREAGTIPYKYFVADRLRNEYIQKFNVQLDSKSNMDKQNNKTAFDSSAQQEIIPTSLSIKKRTAVKRQAKTADAGQRQTTAKPKLKKSQAVATGVVQEVRQSARQSDGVTSKSNNFDAIISLNGELTLMINGQPIHLSAERTKMLAKLIQYTAD